MRPPQGQEIVALQKGVEQLEQDMARQKHVKGKTREVKKDQVLEWKWRLAEKGLDPAFDEKIERESLQMYEDELNYTGKLKKPARNKAVSGDIRQP